LIDPNIGKLVERAVECRHCEVAASMMATRSSCGDVCLCQWWIYLMHTCSHNRHFASDWLECLITEDNEVGSHDCDCPNELSEMNVGSRSLGLRQPLYNPNVCTRNFTTQPWIASAVNVTGTSKMIWQAWLAQRHVSLGHLEFSLSIFFGVSEAELSRLEPYSAGDHYYY
jgi:hypothetical protein